MINKSIFAGNSSIDNVITSDGVFHQNTCGGNCFHAAMAARILSEENRVAILSSVPENFPESIITSLNEHGIDTSLITHESEKVEWNELFVYGADGERRDGIFISLRSDLDGKVLSADEKKRLLSQKYDDYTYADFRRDHVPDISLIPAEWNVISLHLAPSTLSAHKAFLEKRYPLVTLDPGRYLVGMKYDDVIDIIRMTYVFIPSKKEMKFIFDDDNLERSVRKLASDAGTNIICKNGKSGCIVFDSRKKKLYEVGIYPEEKIVNLTGAGDSFCGALNAAIVCGYELLEAARIATVVAAKAIETVSAIDRDKITKETAVSLSEAVPCKEVL